MSTEPAALSADYLRKRFSERIWDSPLLRLLDVMDPDQLDPLVDDLVVGLLIEIGAE